MLSRYLKTARNYRGVFYWAALALPIGAIAGFASALFLASLEWATQYRESHSWLIFLLPVAGFIIALKYRHLGKSVEAGNNLLIDEIHDPKKIVPWKMAPLIFVTTVMTHLFGGSAGREGTAIQMSGSLADQLFRKPHGPDHRYFRQMILISGLSAGFASIFGTPLAGTIFGLEVLRAGGRMRTDALFPALIASLVGHYVTLLLGIHHTVYAVPTVPTLNLATIFYALIAGICFGLVARLFVFATHQITKFSSKMIHYPPVRTMLGGVLFVIIFGWPAMRKYQGLGIATISESLVHILPAYDWFAKLAATALTLGTGFKGGEVTPLFYIGATVGNALSHVLPLAFPVLSGLGFVAVFAGAANVPIASTLLAVELFGAPIASLAAVACVASFLSSGSRGIYSAQRSGDHDS